METNVSSAHEVTTKTMLVIQGLMTVGNALIKMGKRQQQISLVLKVLMLVVFVRHFLIFISPFPCLNALSFFKIIFYWLAWLFWRQILTHSFCQVFDALLSRNFNFFLFLNVLSSYIVKAIFWPRLSSKQDWTWPWLIHGLTFKVS
jgi:hypothetical protein